MGQPPTSSNFFPRNMEFFTKNAGWIITLFCGAVSWFVYIVRQNDKLNRFSEKQNLMEQEISSFKTTMNQLSNNQQNLQGQVQRLEISNVNNTELLNECVTEIRVIAAWVKMQSGDTIIEHRSRKDK